MKSRMNEQNLPRGRYTRSEPQKISLRSQSVWVLILYEKISSRTIRRIDWTQIIPCVSCRNDNDSKQTLSSHCCQIGSDPIAKNCDSDTISDVRGENMERRGMVLPREHALLLILLTPQVGKVLSATRPIFSGLYIRSLINSRYL